jgi:hypothetical protein
MTSPPEILSCRQCYLTLPAGWHRADVQEPGAWVLASATGSGGAGLPRLTISDIDRPMTMLLFRSKGPRIAYQRAREGGYQSEGQPEPRWVTVGGHPAYQATYRGSIDRSTVTVTELLTLDRVLSVGRAGISAWVQVSRDPKNVPSVSRLVLIKFATTEGQHVDYWPDFQHMLESWVWNAPKPPGRVRQLVWGGLPGLWLNRRPDRGGQAQRPDSRP